MSTSVDIHAQLASILERFAKCALLEMSRAVEQEMTRRQMEVETLLVKLQFTENELRSARQNQANLRSVGTQVNNSGQRAMVKRCVFGCFPLKTLFPIPKVPWLRTRWLEFLHFEEGGVTENSRLCSRHFTRECFQNLTQHEMGFAKVLCLTDKAVPSVYTVGASPAAKPQTRDVSCQCPAYGQKKSVSVQTPKSKRRREEVNLNLVKFNENHDGETQTETYTDDSSAQTFALNEDGIKSIQIKEEHMEDGQWDSGPISPSLCPLGPEVDDQDSFSAGTTGPAREDQRIVEFTCFRGISHELRSPEFGRVSSRIRRAIREPTAGSEQCFNSEMSSAAMLHTQISAIMDVLAKAAVAEISQLLEEDAAALHQEIRRRNEEIQGLKTRLMLTETKLQRVTADRCSIGVQVEITGTSSVTPALLLGVSAHSREPRPDDQSQQKTVPTCPVKDLIAEEKPHHSHTLELKREDPVTCSSQPEEEELSGLEFEMKIEQVEELVDQKLNQVQNENRRDDVNSHSWSSKAFDDPEGLIEPEQHSQTFPDPYVMMEDPTAQSSSGLFSLSQNESFGTSGDVEYGLNLHRQERSSDSTAFSASHSSSCAAKTLPQRPHAGTHPGTKPFRCEECGKGFTQRTRLITHRRVHTGEKPFRCQLCGKTFSRQDNCLRHVRLHSGQRW
ncbi:hypothetical protein H4Q32_004655 [Labeo rohita]|uniref:Uncharacterized protein n=1 Tax=Labeo rohita TaxID=84645 RepID=A0ABQ8N1M7_LABRO|nr:hypothetical protein H4Q32_004655 [Labeo rohita]